MLLHWFLQAAATAMIQTAVAVVAEVQKDLLYRNLMFLLLQIVKMPEDYWDDIDFPDHEKAMKGDR